MSFHPSFPYLLQHCDDAGYGSTYFYSGGPGGSPPWPQQAGNPGNPYAAYNGGGGWVRSTGTNLFDFSGGSPTFSGNATSSGQFTGVTLSVSNYASDNGIGNLTAAYVPNGSPAFLLGEAAVKNGTSPNEVFTLQNVPPGTYGLYLYAANEGNNRGTAFSVNSGAAHNGIAATLNGQNGSPAPTFVEGQNFVIFQNVTPNGSGDIVITASPNSQDGVGNSNGAGETDVNGFQLIFNPPPTALGSTAAQNVFAGGAASFSFSPAFVTSPSFRWQMVKNGVTNNLSDVGNISGSGTANLTITNVSAANVGLYQCVISSASATNTSPSAPLTILTSAATSLLQNGEPAAFVGYVLQPGDTLADSGNNPSSAYNLIPAPFDMSVTNVEDGTLLQYVNSGGNGGNAPFSGPVGFTVTPQIGATIVTGLRLFASSSHPEDDPADYLLSGSTDGGNTFTPIAGGLLALPAPRNAAGGAINVTNQVLQEIVFSNSAAYTTYQLTFTNVNNDTTASNGVQIAEVQLLGALPPLAPGFVQPPDATEILLTGAAFHPIVVPSGPGPFSYQWQFNSQNITGATNATFTLTNMQLTNSGTYTVLVTNLYGSTNASTILTVMAPTPYQQGLLALSPMSYWPLNESGGTVAYDMVGGLNGTYTGGGVSFQQTGVPFAGMGSSSYSAFLAGSSYVDIPEGPFSINGPITIMGWVNVTITPRFMNILGHGDTSYRITVNTSGNAGFNDGNNNSGDATDSSKINDGNWHFVAGVYTGSGGSATNGLLYVDGLLAASNEITSVPLNTLDLWIGGAPDYGATRDFIGGIAHAAVFAKALTSNQIQAIYDGAAPSPSVAVPANQVTVDQNGSVSFGATIRGALPFALQWYYQYNGQPTLIPAATNSTLTLSNVQPVQAQYNYYVVVTNAFGAATSSYVTLNILEGPPVIVADISPLQVLAPLGIPLTFTVAASGTEPFSYQWSNGVVAIPGATNSSYTLNVLAGSNTYTVGVQNSQGATNSSTALVVGNTNAPPVLSFTGNGANWATNGSGTVYATFSNSVLLLTSNTGSEATSAFYTTPQYIGGFLASFTYQASGNRAADGITFCLQNDSTNALGAGGGDLAYFGITNSAALELNIYSGDHGGAGITFGTEGNSPDTDPALGNFVSAAPVGLAGGDPINVLIYYSQNVMSVWLTDTVSNTAFNTSFSANLPALVNGSTAYVGFTGATGGAFSFQTVSNFVFSYTTPPVLSVARGTPGKVVVSWPISVASAFVLQESTNLVSGWSNVAIPPVNVNQQNQVTLTPGTSGAYFRLSAY